MNYSLPVEPWNVALPRRVATLVRMAPLLRFEQNKANRRVKLDGHDMRTLGLMVIDSAVERMGLASGATHEEIAESLAPLIRAAEPDADQGRVLEITDLMLDLLLNEAERRRAFSEEIRLPAAEGMETRAVEFHYLHQVHGTNDETLYRATVEGINLYTGTLGLDLEDAHAANAAVMKYQIGRGRFHEAVITAQQAVAITTAYEARLRQALKLAERDVAQVDWAGAMLRMLNEARDHLQIRLDVDGEVRAAVVTAQDDADESEGPAIAELLRHIGDCQTRHGRLHQLVIAADDHWLREHARQAFRPRAIHALPDLEADVLRRAMGLSAAQLGDEASWDLAGRFLGVHIPRVADPVGLVEMLLAPPREIERLELPAPDLDLEEIGNSAPRFSDEDFRATDAILARTRDGKVRVSELLSDAHLSGVSDHVRTLLYLRALLDFDEAPETVEPTADQFDAPPFSGDDLWLRSAIAPQKEEVPRD